MPESHAHTTGKRKLEDGSSLSRKRPMLEPSSPSRATTSNIHSTDEHWMVLWRNPQYKKHKTWDGDGVLVANSSRALLYDVEGKIIGNGKAEFPLYEGQNFSVGSKDLELERSITKGDFLSGQCFGGSNTNLAPVSIPRSDTGLAKKFVPLKPHALTVQKRNTSPSLEQEREGIQPQSASSTPDTATSNPGIKLENSYWTANWRKKQTKKNKTWDGDAYVSLISGKLIMMSEEGKFMGSIPWKGGALYAGYKIQIGGKEVELDSQVNPSQLPTLIGAPRDLDNEVGITEPQDTQSSLNAGVRGPLAPMSLVTAKFVAPTSFYGAPVNSKSKGPLHDPEAEGAVVMKAPTSEHMEKFNKKNLPVVPVVLDPILSRRMRPHQKEGVKFLYESVMALRKHEGQGCILADEMGLGKTLQTISLVWTLLRQNPYSGSARGVVEKVLVVCPVSLVNNWKAEFHKWLGRDRIGVVTCDKDKKTALTFMNAKSQQVLIIGYERLRTVIDSLSSMVPPIGLIICDEGHRLKSASNKTTKMFAALRTRRRIILSGTPIQNDLSEFHAMANFCNPGLLDEYSTFRRVYEVPILKSRAPDASAKDIEVGEARTAQLLTIAKSFVLRRESTLLGDYLPPKHEYVVFVTPTALQLSIFSKILHPDKLDDLAQSSTAESLALINILTKVSNSPILLKATADKAKTKANNLGSTLQRAGVDDALKLFPEKAQIEDMSLSGKLTALARLLQVIRSTTEEKCVLVSHYTSTLNILEAYCQKEGYSYYRLDGQTPAAKRQEYVNNFNRSSRNNSFLFLLSSKAGGVGINLVGASRLCLIDSDWNPSHDLQSMARCHRDGQKRPVYIYRFLTAGTIDEKIYQRQVTKLGLSGSLMGSGSTTSKSDTFSRKDLRDIFRIHLDTPCNTHDLLECPCEGTRDLLPENTPPVDSDEDDSEQEQGFIRACDVKPERIDKIEKVYLQKKKAGLAALGGWKHINCLRPSARDDVTDDILRKLINTSKQMGREEPKPRLEALLSKVDFENITAMDDLLSVRDMPGGTVSYLFEKSSTSTFEHSSVDVENH